MLTAASMLLAAAGLSAQAPGPPAVMAAPAAPRTFHADELLLLSVVLDGSMLTETLGAYGSTSDPYLPLGELARLLDLNVTALPSEQRVTGTLGEARRLLLVDLAAGIARVDGVDVLFDTDDVGISATDIYVRRSLLEKLLPIRSRLDAEDLALELVATETLPIQARNERAGRLRRLGDDGDQARPVMRVPAPYRMVSVPAVDVALESGYDTITGLTQRRYDVRFAGDVLNSGLTGYLGSDDKGSPSMARLRLNRRSPEGDLLGPLHATYAAAGDVFTPLTTMGPRSMSGRGFSFTTGRIGQASVFQRITLRGELPIGYDVELYVNDVLRSGQRSPQQGRYEFVDVPLSRGVNVLRIVIYGPQGQRTEQTRVVNVGAGELERGQIAIDFGAVQQERNLLRLDPQADPASGRGSGKLRAVANLAYGLSDRITVIGGAALYPDYEGKQRRMLSAGLRGSAFGLALLGDYARDLGGASALSAGMAGELLGVSATARHIEYRGNFIDENNLFYNGLTSLARFSAVDLNFSLQPRHSSIPVTFSVQRTGFTNGGASWTGVGRTSTVVAKTLISAGLDYRRDEAGIGGREQQLLTSIAASRFVDYRWQIRAIANVRLLPRRELDALSATVDRTISDRISMRVGAGRTFGRVKDFNTAAGLFFHLPFGDLSASGNYAVKNGWQAALRFAFGLVRDPETGAMRLTRPGVASGGSAAFLAFIDRNDNGQLDAGERPAPGVILEGGERRVVTDRDGRAFVTGLGDNAAANLHADIGEIDAFFVASPPEDIELSARPGRTVTVPYALSPVGEAMVHVWLQAGGKKTGIAAVRIQLVRDGADPATATTEFDGSAFFKNVRAGTYRLRLDPAQQQQLPIQLVGEPTVTVKEDGGVADVEAEIRFGEAHAS